MKIVWLLLTLSCSGHTNAECYPSITKFSTQADCEKARIVPERTSWLGEKIPAYTDVHKVCFASIEEQ